ncbi:MAG: cache domain-containing protein [Terracidiphilus sp.]|jgi:HAMP domain-containing protein
MKMNSIRTKVVVACLCCLSVGLGGILALIHYSFNRNAQNLASQAVTGAQSLFAISEAREIRKMAALTQSLTLDPRIGDALLARDREGLIEMTAPFFMNLKEDGITDFTFHTQELDPAVFLRLNDPARSGDHMDRFMDKEVATKLTMVTGNEMGRAGFAVRTIAPMFGSHGEVAGYVEFGEELGQFLHAMKATTGDDYGLLFDKKYVNQQFWADTNATLNRRDNWNDEPNYVAGEKTSNSDRIFDFKGNLSAVPTNGEALERFHEGKSEFVRGVFPIQDAAGNRVGAIFVVRDITNFYLSMQRTELIFAVSTVIAVLIGTGIFLLMLSRLIFQRLERIIQVATRVVGGDHGTEIKVSSDDEVGQLEGLFEQFRQVFVFVLSNVPELESK